MISNIFMLVLLVHCCLRIAPVSVLTVPTSQPDNELCISPKVKAFRKNCTFRGWICKEFIIPWDISAFEADLKRIQCDTHSVMRIL